MSSQVPFSSHLKSLYPAYKASSENSRAPHLFRSTNNGVYKLFSMYHQLYYFKLSHKNTKSRFISSLVLYNVQKKYVNESTLIPFPTTTASFTHVLEIIHM